MTIVLNNIGPLENKINNAIKDMEKKSLGAITKEKFAKDAIENYLNSLRKSKLIK